MLTKIFGCSTLALAIALALTFLWGKAGWRDAASYKLAADTLKTSYRAAQATATANAITAKLTTEAAYRAKAEKSDAAYQIALDRARGALSAYAERMRAQGVGSSGGETPAPANDRDPGLPQGAPEDAILVSRLDLDICTENSVKIEQAWEWAPTLNEPIPDPAFAHP